MKTALVIPTHNGGEIFQRVINALSKQTLRPEIFLIIDSGSTDNTLDRARAAGAKIHQIKKEDFDHGATRNLARVLVEADVYIFLTQDSVPANRDTLKQLVLPLLEYSQVGLTYGRQISHPGSRPIEAFSRLFSYPVESRMKRKTDSAQMGLKTVLCSNACAAYRREAFDLVGGFPPEVIMCEDVYIAAKMLQAGYAIYYAADALVYHSHNYTVSKEFKRYFDIGVFYESTEHWIMEEFGGASKQGLDFFLSGLQYLNMDHNYHLYPEWIIRTLAKIIAYKLGAKEKLLANPLKKYLSMNSSFWKL